MNTKFRFAFLIVFFVCRITLMYAGQSGSSSAEKIPYDSANRERTQVGLPALEWSPPLAVAALAHSRLLAQHQSLSHQFFGEQGLAERTKFAGARFSSVAENIAEGPDAASIHEQWMKSPPHRANLLDAGLNSIGIAVTERNGTLFATEDFSTSIANLSVSAQEQIVSSRLQIRGLRLLRESEQARRSCAMDNGYAGTHALSFVLHYTTKDLESLPDMLERRIATRKYKAASVGACPADSRVGFSQYRVAILLFE